MSELIVYSQQISVPYRYAAGYAQQAFLRGLQERRIVGSRARDGRVLVPPRTYDEAGVPTESELVEVADTGTLQGWTEVVRSGEPRVYGLIRLDGADTDLLHLVDSPAEFLTLGLRVVARWADKRQAEVTAIAAFVPA